MSPGILTPKDVAERPIRGRSPSFWCASAEAHPPAAARPDGEIVQVAAIGDGLGGAISLTPGGAPMTDARASYKLDQNVPCP
jgi:hypothetical protein